jgi:hypothetical protein
MANQTVVDAIVKVLTDAGYSLPVDTVQLPGLVDNFISTAGFTLAPSEDAQDQQVDADQAQVASDQAVVDADQAKLDSDEVVDQAEDASATPEVESGISK